MPIENADYFVRVVAFPVPVPAFVRLNPDGITYSIYINANMSWERQAQGLEHEIQHIINDDLFSDRDILEIESQLL